MLIKCEMLIKTSLENLKDVGKRARRLGSEI